MTPQIFVDPTNGAKGTQIHVWGENFIPFSHTSVTIEGQTISDIDLGSEGFFSFDAEMPDLPAGTARIAAAPAPGWVEFTVIEQPYWPFKPIPPPVGGGVVGGVVVAGSSGIIIRQLSYRSKVERTRNKFKNGDIKAVGYTGSYKPSVKSGPGDQPAVSIQLRPVPDSGKQSLKP